MKTLYQIENNNAHTDTEREIERDGEREEKGGEERR